MTILEDTSSHLGLYASECFQLMLQNIEKDLAKDILRIYAYGTEA